jgi:hypothetical protein
MPAGSLVEVAGILVMSQWINGGVPASRSTIWMTKNPVPAGMFFQSIGGDWLPPPFLATYKAGMAPLFTKAELIKLKANGGAGGVGGVGVYVGAGGVGVGLGAGVETGTTGSEDSLGAEDSPGADPDWAEGSASLVSTF